MRRLVLAIIVVATCARAAWAHKPSDAHVRLTSGADGVIAGRVDISVRDLDAALGVDTNGNGDITWDEVRAAEPRLADYVRARLAFAGDGTPCALTVGAPGASALVDLVDGAYWAEPLTVTCATRPRELAVTYKLMFDLDAQHRGIIHLDGAIVVVRDSTPAKLALGPARSTAPPLLAGMRAVALGIDRVVVLACLLVPLAWRRRRTTISTTGALELAAVFIFGQLITLGLIATGTVQLPAGVVDVIVYVLALAAIGNAIARVIELRWPHALELGMVQGFALGGALARLGPPTQLGVHVVARFALGALVASAAIAIVLAVIGRRAARAIADRGSRLR